MINGYGDVVLFFLFLEAYFPLSQWRYSLSLPILDVQKIKKDKRSLRHLRYSSRVIATSPSTRDVQQARSFHPFGL